MSQLPLGVSCPAALQGGADHEPPMFTSREARLARAFRAVVAWRLNAMTQGTGPAHEVDRLLREQGLDPERDRSALWAMRPDEHAASLRSCYSNTRAAVAYSLNPETGRAVELGVGIQRAYRAAGMLDTPEHDELPGTVDAQWTERNGNLVVVMLWQLAGDPCSQPLAEHLRLGALALSALSVRQRGLQQSMATAASADIHKALADLAVRGEIRHVTDDGACRTEAIEYDEFALAMLAGQVAAVWRARHGGEARPGEHCAAWCCRRLGSCPAVAELWQVFPELAAPLFGVTEAEYRALAQAGAP